MKAVINIITCAALAGYALAKPVLTNSNYDIEIGKPFTFTWTDATTVSLVVKTGDPNNLQTFETITTSATGGSYTWTPTDLPNGVYAIQITDPLDPSNPNYSSQFTITGSTVSASASASASTSAAPTSSAPTTTAATTSASSSAATTSGSSSKSGSTITTTTTAAKTTTSAPSATVPSTNGNGAGALAIPVLAPLLGLVLAF